MRYFNDASKGWGGGGWGGLRLTDRPEAAWWVGGSSPPPPPPPPPPLEGRRPMALPLSLLSPSPSWGRREIQNLEDFLLGFLSKSKPKFRIWGIVKGSAQRSGALRTTLEVR